MANTEEDKLLDYYCKKLNISNIKLNPKEIEILKELSKIYPIEDLKQAINLMDNRPTRKTSLKDILIKNLKELKLIKDIEIKKEEKKDIDISEKNSEIKNFNYLLEDHWKNFFEKNKIPYNIIDVSKIKNLNQNLKNIFIANKVAEYIFTHLSEKEKEEILKKAEKHINKLHIKEEEKNEAIKMIMLYIIKRKYNINF